MGGWLAAVAVAVVVIGLLLGGALTSDGEITNDPESSRAYDLLGERLPPEPNPSYGDELVIVRSDKLTADDPAFRAKVEEVARAVESTKATNSVQTFFRDGDRSLLSSDRSAAVVFIRMGAGPEGNIEGLVDTALAADGGAFDVTITGEWTADRDILQLSEDDLSKGEFFFGLPAALVILLLVFGAVVAGLVPLMLAIVSIVGALALTALVGQAFDLSVFVVNMLSGMGLALVRLLAVHPVPLPRGAGARARQGRRDRRGGRDVEPRGALQRDRVRARAAGDGDRARHDPAQPGHRRDPRRDRPAPSGEATRRGRGARRRRQPGDARDRGGEAAARGRRPGCVRGSRRGGPRHRRDGGERRLLRARPPVAADRLRVRARPELRSLDDRVPLDRRTREGGRAQPALRRRGLRPADTRLPEGSRQRALRLPAGGDGRGMGAALPLLGPLRPLDGLPRLPAQPDQRAVHRDG